ncbi:tetratricopeptide repeat protein [Anaeromyxobacter oryzisoli]|uniref:tetratricopeptide repeat protein n=1 Tax=Anaeromyxobacter oryzisoli TaxID=2925408 RepID=UPI001F5ACF97|nr:tetratricopeptide repeat protein [Anaeromyxobacter sp. SG63]
MSSILEKYEQILAADPRSRIFVELAKALVERGEAARAIEVCRQGLEHHPTSILGRVVWGRALLESADTKGAMDQFEIAIALDPASPYPYNLIAEALLGKGLYREALPVATRAVELQPADPRAKRWLEDARSKVQEEDGAAGGPAATADGGGEPTAAGDDAPANAAANGDAEAAAGAAEADATAGSSTVAGETAAGDADATAGAAGPAGETGGNGEPSGDAGASERPAPERMIAANGEAAEDPAEHTATFALPGATANGDASAADSANTTEVASTSGDAQPGEDETSGAADASAGPPAIPIRPPPLRGAAAPPLPDGSLLAMIPGSSGAPGPRPRSGAALAVATAADADAAAEADRIAAQYEQEIRARLADAPEPPVPSLRRHRKLVLAAAALLAIGGAVAVYLLVDGRRASDLATNAASKARAGIARDTRGSLTDAAALLAEARRRAPRSPELLSLAAQANALLAVDHGVASARAAAELAGRDDAGDGALAARWLLAETPEARREAADAILAAPPSSEPLVEALAGRILLERGEVEAGRGRLAIAARVNEAGARDEDGWPPLLRAVAALGDLALAGGDAEQALALQRAALAAQPTHPGAVVGAAEARLALGRELDVSRKELAAVDADPASAPPADLRLRYELVTARVLAASGDPGKAAERLARVARERGETAPLAEALAEVHLAARAWERAEDAAARAVTLAPKDAGAHVLLARARIGRGRFAEALAATDGLDGRAVRLQRAIARYRLGQLAQARAELERTTRDGRMPAEAAVWYAIVDLAQGRADRALALLEKLTSGKTPPPGAHVALGRALEAQGRPADAEKAYRAALERDPTAPDANAALGALLLARGDAAGALPLLEGAAAADPSDLDARRALGAARLAAKAPAAARADLDVVLLARPADSEALRLLSAAWLAEGQPAEALRAANRGIAAASRDPRLLLAGARAALAAGDRPQARSLAERAVKAGAQAADAAEARKIAAEANQRKG